MELTQYYFSYSTWTGRPTLYLEDLFVKPEYRNKNIGKRLFKRLGEVAKAHNCARMDWQVIDWNACVSVLTPGLRLRSTKRCLVLL